MWVNPYVPILSLNTAKFLQSFIPSLYGIDEYLLKYSDKNKYMNNNGDITLKYDKSEFKNAVLRKAIDLNTDSTNITINDKKEYDDDVLLNLFMNDNIDKDTEKEDNNSLGIRMFEWVKNYLNSNTFFNNPNMVL